MKKSNRSDKSYSCSGLFSRFLSAFSPLPLCSYLFFCFTVNSPFSWIPAVFFFISAFLRWSFLLLDVVIWVSFSCIFMSMRLLVSSCCWFFSLCFAQAIMAQMKAVETAGSIARFECIHAIILEYHVDATLQVGSDRPQRWEMTSGWERWWPVAKKRDDFSCAQERAQAWSMEWMNSHGACYSLSLTPFVLSLALFGYCLLLFLFLFFFFFQGFTTDNGLMTPTLKLRRVPLLNRYCEQLKELYSSIGEPPRFDSITLFVTCSPLLVLHVLSFLRHDEKWWTNNPRCILNCFGVTNSFVL